MKQFQRELFKTATCSDKVGCVLKNKIVQFGQISLGNDCFLIQNRFIRDNNSARKIGLKSARIGDGLNGQK